MAREYLKPKDYEKVLNLLEKGFTDTREFKRLYNKVRAVANYRIKTLDNLGLDSKPLSDVKAFNFIQSREKFFSARTKQQSAYKTFKTMVNFINSPFSSQKTYKKAVEIEDSIKKHFEKLSKKYGDIDADWDDLTRFIANGDFDEIVKITGNSPEVLRDLEDLFSEGVNYYEVKRAFDKFKAGKIDYETALAQAQKEAKERQKEEQSE